MRSDKLIDWYTPFANTEWLVCETCSCFSNYNLDIYLVEHNFIGKGKDIDPSENATDLDKMMDDADMVGKTINSREWRVCFDETVAFKFGNESFYWGPGTSNDVKSLTCRNSATVNESSWMQEIKRNGYFLEKCQHYVIFSSHSTIEIIAAEKPIIYSSSET